MSIHLADVFSDSMILQRGRPIRVWGNAEPGRTVRVRFSGVERRSRADSRGAWSVTLPPMPDSAQPADLEARYAGTGGGDSAGGAAGAAVIRDILVGDVWFCSGQSNMEMGITAAENGPAEAASSDCPAIRYLLIEKTSAALPTEKISARWTRCSPDSVVKGGWGGLSAIGLLFARRILEEERIPVGIIQSAYGGSSIHPWLTPEVLGRYACLRQLQEEKLAADACHARELASNPGAVHPFSAFTEYNTLKPCTTYNVMVHPLVRFPIRGILWYQGESNAGDPDYAVKMKALVEGLRRAWKDPRLPFYYAQIAPWTYTEGDLTRLWENQYAAEAIPHTGMAVTVDVGDPKDIHPVRKAPVADRLARLALRGTYGRKGLPCRGPVLDKVRYGGGAAELLFKADGDLRTSDGSPPACFELAGEDRVFHPAQAAVSGKRITVKCYAVPRPLAARYAWHDAVTGANLYDDAGLPARPFRTDCW